MFNIWINQGWWVKSYDLMWGFPRSGSELLLSCQQFNSIMWRFSILPMHCFFLFFINKHPLTVNNVWSLNNVWSSVISEFIESWQSYIESLKANFNSFLRGKASYRRVCWGIRPSQTNYGSSQLRAVHFLTALLVIPSHLLATQEVTSHQNYLWAPFLTEQFHLFTLFFCLRSGHAFHLVTVDCCVI